MLFIFEQSSAFKNGLVVEGDTPLGGLHSCLLILAKQTSFFRPWCKYTVRNVSPTRQEPGKPRAAFKKETSVRDECFRRPRFYGALLYFADVFYLFDTTLSTRIYRRGFHIICPRSPRSTCGLTCGRFDDCSNPGGKRDRFLASCSSKADTRSCTRGPSRITTPTTCCWRNHRWDGWARRIM